MCIHNVLSLVLRSYQVLRWMISPLHYRAQLLSIPTYKRLRLLLHLKGDSEARNVLWLAQFVAPNQDVPIA